MDRFFDPLPNEISHNIFGFLDLPEVANLRCVNRLYRNYLTSSEFTTLFNDRLTTHVWAFTHYLTDLTQRSGFLQGVRLEDQRIITLPIEAEELLEDGDDFRLIGASGNLFLFKRRRLRWDSMGIVLFVIDPFLSELRTVICDPIHFSPINDFLRVQDVSILANPDGRSFIIRYYRTALGIAQYFEYDSVTRIWTMESAIIGNILDFNLDVRNRVITYPDVVFIIWFPPNQNRPFYAIEGAGQLLNPAFNNLELEHLQGDEELELVWEECYSGEGWATIIETHVNRGVPNVTSVRSALLFKLRDSRTRYDLTSVVPHDLVMRDVHLVMGNLHLTELDNETVYIGFLTHHLLYWSFTVFSFNTRYGTWMRISGPPINALWVHTLVFTNHLNIT